MAKTHYFVALIRTALCIAFLASPNHALSWQAHAEQGCSLTDKTETGYLSIGYIDDQGIFFAQIWNRFEDWMTPILLANFSFLGQENLYISPDKIVSLETTDYNEPRAISIISRDFSELFDRMRLSELMRFEIASTYSDQQVTFPLAGASAAIDEFNLCVQELQ